MSWRDRFRGRRSGRPDRPARGSGLARAGLSVVVPVRADRTRHLVECLRSLADPGDAPAEVLLAPYGDDPVPVPGGDPTGTAPFRVLDPVGTLTQAYAAGLAAAGGAAIGFLAPTDTALPGYAALATSALGLGPSGTTDAADGTEVPTHAWTPSARRGGPLAEVAAAPPRLADAVLRTAALRELGWPADDAPDDPGLVLLAHLDARAADPAVAVGSEAHPAWASWEDRDHALGFGFEPDLAAELDPWLTTAEAAFATVADTAPVTRAAWGARLLAGLDVFLAQVEELDDAQWQRLRAAAMTWAAAMDEPADFARAASHPDQPETGPAPHPAERLGVWARAALHLVRDDDRDTLAELVDQRDQRPEDLRTSLAAGPAGGTVLAQLPGGDAVLTRAETPAWASLRRLTWQEPTASRPGGLVLALATGIRHLDLAEHPPEVEVALVASGTSYASGMIAPEAHDVRAHVTRHVLPSVPAPALGRLRYVDQRPGGRTALVPVELLITLDGEYAVEVTVRAGGIVRTTGVTEAELRGSAGEPVLAGHAGRTLRAAYAPATGVRVEVTAGTPDPQPGPASGALGDVRLEGTTLVVTGQGTAHHGRSLELAGAGRVVGLDTTWDGDAFRAVTDLHHPWVGGGVRLLPSAAYRLRWAGAATAADRVAPPAPALLADLPRQLDHPRARLEVRRAPNTTTAVAIGPPLRDDERGPFAQQQLIDTYRRADDRGIALDRDLVYFQSFTGASPTDSPAAIHAELRRRAPHLRTVWGVADGSVPAPEGAEAVVIRSAAWYDVLARAGHLVTNIEVEPWFRLRAGQRLLQTFHGYPSKAMGLDFWRAKHMPAGKIRRKLARSRETWSAILTPAPEMNRHYREQYAYDGPIIDVGYPRDDALLAPDVAARRAAARAVLGLRPDQVAVLHAPTWRDDSARNFRVADGAGVLDPARLAADLGETYVVLQRAHRFHPEATGRGERVIDVSEHPEINDLILASDAGVFDYSSLRFDYALTGKPMVFCVPDLDSYTHDARGFLFPYTESTPGPLCAEHDEVVAALRDLDGLRATYAAELAAFTERFHPIRDGRASARVVDAFFGDLLGG